MLVKVTQTEIQRRDSELPLRDSHVWSQPALFQSCTNQWEEEREEWCVDVMPNEVCLNLHLYVLEGCQFFFKADLDICAIDGFLTKKVFFLNQIECF